MDVKYVTYATVAGATTDQEEEADTIEEGVGTVKCEQWLVFFILFQILQFIFHEVVMH